jgi:hypothetical protein
MRVLIVEDEPQMPEVDFLTLVAPLGWALLALGRELPAERGLVEVVDEGSPAVDLDDREPLPVGLLECVDARDVDFLVREAELAPQPLQLRARPVAERAPLTMEEDDVTRDRGRA